MPSLYDEIKSLGEAVDLSELPGPIVQWMDTNIASFKQVYRAAGYDPNVREVVEIAFITATVIAAYEDNDDLMELVTNRLSVTAAQFMRFQLSKSIDVPDDDLPEM